MTDLTAHFFRHEYSRLVALLCRRIGVQHLEIIEDAVQSALMAAIETWPRPHPPENPTAWLFRVAHNHVVGELRRNARREALATQHLSQSESGDAPHTFLEDDVRDDLLRMLFICCDDVLPVDSQLALALKVLCGFDVREISERLFSSEASIYKRLNRARTRLRESDFENAELTARAIASRLPAVHAILYTLFTEGYLSSHAEGAIRRELCDEAIRLNTELASHPAGAVPETFALLALMHLHSARMLARQDSSGGLLLLEEQDRSLWDTGEIAIGLKWLARSAEGETFRAITRKRRSRQSTVSLDRSQRRAGSALSTAMRCSSSSRPLRSTRSIARLHSPSCAALKPASSYLKRSHHPHGSVDHTFGPRLSQTCIAEQATWTVQRDFVRSRSRRHLRLR